MDLLLPPITPVAFTGIISLAWVGVFLMLGMFLRSTFPLFSKYLIPSCVIGGVMGLVFQNTGIADKIGLGMDISFLQLVVYHLFCLTWIYVGLRKPDKSEAKKTKETSKRVVWYWGVTLLASASTVLVTATLSVFLFNLGFTTGPQTGGLLVAYAFTTGPGQALTVATIWSNAKEFVGLVDFGLASGAMGFAVAITVGIFLVNLIARRAKLDTVTCPSPEEECGYYGECTEKDEAGKQTTSVTSIDVLAWHIAIGLVTYFIATVIAVALFMILPPAVKVLIWAMFFLLCSLVAIGVRNLMMKFGFGHLLCNGMNSRLSNSIVDFMVCGTFISIALGNVLEYSMVFILCSIATVVTVFAVCWILFSKLKEDSIQAFAFAFGTMTGTISTGFILLRLVDPQGKSPVPIHYALGNAVGLVPGIILSPIMHLEVLYGYSPWVLIASHVGVVMLCITVCFVFRQPQSNVAWSVTK